MALQLTTPRLKMPAWLQAPVPPRMIGRLAATACAALLVFTAGGCTTPVLQSSVQVPDRFTTDAPSGTATEVAWWGRYGDPVLSDLIRSAAYENRDIKIAAERVRAARAGETISRSWLLPASAARPAPRMSAPDIAAAHSRQSRTRSPPVAG